MCSLASHSSWPCNGVEEVGVEMVECSVGIPEVPLLVGGAGVEWGLLCCLMRASGAGLHPHSISPGASLHKMARK